MKPKFVNCFKGDMVFMSIKTYFIGDVLVLLS